MDHWAGVTSVFTTYPLEVIRVRLAFETKRDSRSSLTQICKRIYNEKPPPPKTTSAAPAVLHAAQAITTKSGLSNFYRGFSATFLGMLPYAGMSFLTHDTAGDLLRHPMIAKYTTLPRPSNSPGNKTTTPPIMGRIIIRWGSRTGLTNLLIPIRSYKKTNASWWSGRRWT